MSSPDPVGTLQEALAHTARLLEREPLLAAERDTPQEIRYRPWAQDLTRALLSTSVRGHLPSTIRDFAKRVGVA